MINLSMDQILEVSKMNWYILISLLNILLKVIDSDRLFILTLAKRRKFLMNKYPLIIFCWFCINVKNNKLVVSVIQINSSKQK